MKANATAPAKRPSPAIATPSGASIGWLLFGFAAMLPWLVPLHDEPWSTFHSGFAAALAALPLAVVAVFARRGRWQVDLLAASFAAAALIPLLQAAFGQFIVPAEAPIIALYLAGFALAAIVARRSEAVTPGRLCDALFGGLLAAALVSSALALAQWLDFDGGVMLVALPSGGRPSANLGQPNQLSTLLAWGLVALWWFHTHQRIGARLALGAAAWLLLGIACTQSRTGWLAVALLIAAALLGHRRFGTTSQRGVFVALGAFFVLLVLAWPSLTALWVPQQASLSLDGQLSGGKRPAIWALMLDGIRHHPWAGVGWNQGRLVQLELWPDHPPLHVTVQHAHNLVLDLLVWNGLPLGLLMVGGLVAWFVWQWRRATAPAEALILLALGVFVLHAMLELPHCEATFLIPVALMMGALNARTSLPTLARVPRGVVAAAVLILGSAVVLIGVEYSRIEADLHAYRFRQARIGNLVVPPPPEIHLLSALQTALVTLRIEPRAGMPASELEALRKTLSRYPVDSGLLRYAHAAALNQQAPAAQQALVLLCELHRQHRCDAAKAHWKELGASHAEIARIAFPATR